VTLELQAGSVPEEGFLDQGQLATSGDSEGIPDRGMIRGVNVLVEKEFAGLNGDLEQNFPGLPILHLQKINFGALSAKTRRKKTEEEKEEEEKPKHPGLVSERGIRPSAKSLSGLSPPGNII
jgi:hypothetical protein